MGVNELIPIYINGERTNQVLIRNKNGEYEEKTEGNIIDKAIGFFRYDLGWHLGPQGELIIGGIPVEEGAKAVPLAAFACGSGVERFEKQPAPRPKDVSIFTPYLSSHELCDTKKLQMVTWDKVVEDYLSHLFKLNPAYAASIENNYSTLKEALIKRLRELNDEKGNPYLEVNPTAYQKAYCKRGIGSSFAGFLYGWRSVFLKSPFAVYAPSANEIKELITGLVTIEDYDQKIVERNTAYTITVKGQNLDKVKTVSSGQITQASVNTLQISGTSPAKGENFTITLYSNDLRTNKAGELVINLGAKPVVEVGSASSNKEFGFRGATIEIKLTGTGTEWGKGKFNVSYKTKTAPKNENRPTISGPPQAQSDTQATFKMEIPATATLKKHTLEISTELDDRIQTQYMDFIVKPAGGGTTRKPACSQFDSSIQMQKLSAGECEM